jgi:hypothetical protein
VVSAAEACAALLAMTPSRANRQAVASEQGRFLRRLRASIWRDKEGMVDGVAARVANACDY